MHPGKRAPHSGKRAPGLRRRHLPSLRLLLWFITTIALPFFHPLLHAQAVTKKALGAQPTAISATQDAPASPITAQTTPPATLPDLDSIPFAIPLPQANPDHIVADSDTESKHGDIYLLAGDVEITFRNRHIRADSVQLNKDTGDLVAEGHLRVSGGDNDEYIQASHGTYNVRTGTGRFFDANGSVGLHNQTEPASGVTSHVGLESPNPFLFTGRIVEKTGPENYTIYDGTVTSCLLPKPDWLFSSSRFAIAGGRARAASSVFHLLGLPVLYLPYLTTPASGGQRQSGLLIPVLGDSSTKGITVGEEGFIVLGRSADLTVGTVYYSLRGFLRVRHLPLQRPGR